MTAAHELILPEPKLGLARVLRAWLLARRSVRLDRLDARHEPETPFIRFLLRPDDVSFHVGASEGRHAFAMAQAAPRGRIYAFEPNAYSYRALRHLIRMHGMTGIETFRAAVSDRAGAVTLNVPVKTTGREGRSLGLIGAEVRRSDVPNRAMRTETVPAVTLDGFVAERGLERVDFIRMDIEGAEALALAGAEKTLDRFHPSLLLEIHPVSLRENFGSSSEAVVDGLLARGYRMFELLDGRVLETHARVTASPWKDYFFIHPSRAGALPEGVFRALMTAPPAAEPVPTRPVQETAA